MGELPLPPPPPPGAPILLALLSLVGSGAPGDGGGQIYFQRELPPREHQRWRGGSRPIPLQPLALVLWDADRPRANVGLARDTPGFARPGGLERGRVGRWGPRGPSLLAENRRPGGNRQVQGFERLSQKRAGNEASLRQLRRRRRRGFLWPPPLRDALGGKRNVAAAIPLGATSATSFPGGPKDIPDPSGPGGEGRLTPPPHRGAHASLPAPSAEAGAPQPTGCSCPGGDARRAQGPLRKGAKGPRHAGPRIPTPRTEEAAWAASALGFLLAVLTLAVLYTRLHRKCRRGRSLYWAAQGEDGHDTVAAVLKRRLLSAQARRKKRSRQLQPRPLLSATSSDSSE